MKILITRIKSGEVKVERKIKASVGRGLALFVCVELEDTDSILLEAAQKIVNLRIFEDESGRMRHSVQERKYQLLCIPNFTLCGSTKKGRRPSFEEAMRPNLAEKMFDKLIVLLKGKVEDVQQGVFRAHMDINLNLDGPVNINLKI